MSEKEIPESINNLVRRITALHDEAAKLGMFIGDRELISCPWCGLMEDVDVNGILLTCRPGSLGVDTGLSFEEIDSGESRFRCPSCGKEVNQEEDHRSIC